MLYSLSFALENSSVFHDFLGHRIGLIEVSKEDRNMTDNFEKKVAVDGPVVNAGELGSSTFSPGQALLESVRSFCGFCVTARAVARFKQRIRCRRNWIAP